MAEMTDATKIDSWFPSETINEIQSASYRETLNSLFIFDKVSGDGRQDEVSSYIRLASARSRELDQVFRSISVISRFQIKF